MGSVMIDERDTRASFTQAAPNSARKPLNTRAIISSSSGPPTASFAESTSRAFFPAEPRTVAGTESENRRVHSSVSFSSGKGPTSTTGSTSARGGREQALRREL
jgi:hypothetical protein